jgi:hypothetical protein
MKFSLDLIQIGLLQRFYLTIRVYNEISWGPRKLGVWRYAFDIAWISIVVGGIGYEI